MLPDTRYIFQPYLTSGEEISWAAAPGPNRHKTKSNLGLLFFALFWTGFSLFWEAGAISAFIATLAHKEQLWPAIIFTAIFPLFGLPFVGIGFYMLAYIFYLDKKIRENTSYAVTSKRILILSGTNRKALKLDSINLEGIRELRLQEFPDGYGTIEIVDIRGMASGYQSSYGSKLFNRAGRNSNSLPSLEAIPDVAKVHRIISENMAHVQEEKTSSNDDFRPFAKPEEE